MLETSFARPRGPRPDSRFAFANGAIINRGGSATPIYPNGAEGRVIQGIYDRQRQVRLANAKQHARVDAIRRSAIPQSFVSPYNQNRSGTPVFSESFANPDYPRLPAERAADLLTLLHNTIQFIGSPGDAVGIAPGMINPSGDTRVAGHIAENKPLLLGPMLTEADLYIQTTSIVAFA